MFRSDPEKFLQREVPSAAGGTLPIIGGVRRWQIVLLALMVAMALAIFIVVKFFEFVGSQN